MPTYNKVVYDGQTLIDLTGDTVTSAADIVSGKIGHLADGSIVVGTASGGGEIAGYLWQDKDGYIQFGNTMPRATVVDDILIIPNNLMSLSIVELMTSVSNGMLNVAEEVLEAEEEEEEQHAYDMEFTWDYDEWTGEILYGTYAEISAKLNNGETPTIHGIIYNYVESDYEGDAYNIVLSSSNTIWWNLGESIFVLLSDNTFRCED